LYPVPISLFQGSPSPQEHLVSLLVWHQRLGHAHLENVKKILRRYYLPCSSKRCPSVCSGCCLRKMHKLPFPPYLTVSCTWTFRLNLQ
ncbi:hypothetical protein LINPERHAP1_LOCUS18682, partial [Linum perenne]